MTKQEVQADIAKVIKEINFERQRPSLPLEKLQELLSNLNQSLKVLTVKE